MIMKKLLLFMIASAALASCDDNDDGCKVTEYDTTTIYNGAYTIQADKATVYDCGNEYKLQINDNGTVTTLPKNEVEIIYDGSSKELTVARK